MVSPLRLVILSCAISLISAAAPSSAAADFKIGIDGNVDMSRVNLQSWTPLTAATGATLYRTQANWAGIAPVQPTKADDPADQAYRWAAIDNTVRVASAVGGEVLLNVLRAPKWAEGPNRPTTGYGPLGDQPPMVGSWNPDPVALGKFATAIARRYDGSTPDPLINGATLPRIRLFEAWNEPEFKRYLTPQCSVGQIKLGGKCSHRGKVIVGQLYRTMLNAFYAGIKQVQPDAIVSIGGLAGGNASSMGPEIPPFQFLRELLCLKEGRVIGSLMAKSEAECPVKANFDAVSYHPYTLFGKPTSKSPVRDGLVLGDTRRLVATVKFAVDHSTVLPVAPKETWATEVDWLTCPPCGIVHSTGKPRGLPEPTAAAYTSETMYRLWSWGVSKAVWFELVDSPSWLAGGLYAEAIGGADPVPKLSLRAIRFPVFSAKTRGGAFAWALSPCRSADDTVTFRAKSGTKWVDVATGSPQADGTIRTNTWAIPRRATMVKAIASGPSCEATTSLIVTIQPS